MRNMTSAPWARGRKPLVYGGLLAWAPGTASALQVIILIGFCSLSAFDGLELGE